MSFCPVGCQPGGAFFIYDGFCLNDEAIIYMENRFKNGASEVLDWLGKVRSAIPFA